MLRGIALDDQSHGKCVKMLPCLQCQNDYLITMLALFSLLRKRQTVLFCAMPCRAVFYEGVS